MIAPATVFDRDCNPMYQVELLRLDPTLLGSLPSTAAPVLRNIHACFVAGRLLRYATLWPHPDPNSTPEPDPNSNPDPTPTPNPDPNPDPNRPSYPQRR